jgi:halocyanin-like protein
MVSEESRIGGVWTVSLVALPVVLCIVVSVVAFGIVRSAGAVVYEVVAHSPVGGPFALACVAGLATIGRSMSGTANAPGRRPLARAVDSTEAGSPREGDSSVARERRAFLRSTGGLLVAGTGVAAGLSGSVAAQEAEPDWDGWLDDANEYAGTEDFRGEDAVEVQVGAGDGLAFDPPGIWIDPGTTVTWIWTGEGGQHNVVTEGGEPLESELTEESGFTYEHTFETGDEITSYYCEPHLSVGMKGAVAVGDDVPVTEGGAGEMEPTDMGVDIREHYVGVAAMLSIVVSLVFTFYVLKYGESPHAKGGQR